MNRRRMTIPTLSTALLLALAGCAGEEAEAESGSTETASSAAPTHTTSAPAAEPTQAPVPEPTADLAVTGAQSGIVVAEAADGDGGGARVQVIDTETWDSEVLGQFAVQEPQYRNEFSDYPIEVRRQFNADFTRMAGYADGSFGWFTPFDEFVDVGAQMQEDTDEFTRGSVYRGGVFDGEGNYYFAKAPKSDGGYKELIDEMFMIPAGGSPEDVESQGAPPSDQSGENFQVNEKGLMKLCNPICFRWESRTDGSTGGSVADWISDTEFLTLNADRTMIYRDVVAPYTNDRGPTDTQKPILPETGREVFSPVVSPDGTRFAFLTPSEKFVGNLDLFVGPLDGSTPPKRMEPMGFVAPEGSRLAAWL